MNRVVHFEVQAEDPESAARFYQEVFDWKIASSLIPGAETIDENCCKVTHDLENEPSRRSALLFHRSPAKEKCRPSSSFIGTVGVADLDKYVKRALKAGGSIVIPRMTIRGRGWLAYCQDKEKNIFGIMQRDESAQ